jgi:hypothetical protein
MISKFKRTNLNESEDKKSKFLNFIIQDFFNKHLNFIDGGVEIFIDQFVDYNDPYFFDKNDIKRDLDNEDQKRISIKGYEYKSDYHKSLYNIFEGYGLSDDEMVTMWEVILKKMLNVIENQKPINESVDKKEIYLNYIVNTFIDRHLTIDDLGYEIYVFLRVENNGSGKIFLDTTKEYIKESIDGEIAAGYAPDNYLIDSMFALIMEEYYDIYGENQQNYIRIKIYNELGNRLSKMFLNESESKSDRFEQFIYDDFINNFIKTNGRGAFTFLPPIEEDDPNSWVNWYILNIRTTDGELRNLNPDPGYTEWYLDNEIVEVFNTRYGINDLNKIQDIWFSICDRLLLKLIDERDSRKIS